MEQLLNIGLYDIPEDCRAKIIEDEWKVVVNAEDVEQKPSDTVEPKFKVGDWIVSKYMHLIMQILNNDNGSYKTVETDGTERNDSYDFIERNFKLWSIEDAKDGDVLAEDSCIFIIQKLGDNNTAAKTYCTLYDDGDFDDGSILYFDVDSTKPATKEQRDTLMKAMADAGWEFDFEKKELKKIEQKPAWGEEDEEILRTIISDGIRCAGLDMLQINWLKSLKERIGG